MALFPLIKGEFYVSHSSHYNFLAKERVCLGGVRGVVAEKVTKADYEGV